MLPVIKFRRRVGYSMSQLLPGLTAYFVPNCITMLYDSYLVNPCGGAGMMKILQASRFVSEEMTAYPRLYCWCLSPPSRLKLLLLCSCSFAMIMFTFFGSDIVKKKVRTRVPIRCSDSASQLFLQELVSSVIRWSTTHAHINVKPHYTPLTGSLGDLMGRENHH